MGKSVLKAIGRTGISYTICIVAALLTCILMAGCGQPQVYIHASPGLDRIKRIAVMPFDNLTKDSKAGEKVRTGFVIELLRTGSFDVIDIAETDRILREAGLSYTAATGQRMSTAGLPGAAGEATKEAATSVPLSKSIGDALKVDAIIAGSVDTYSSERTREQTVPEVSIAARLIHAETGTIIWAGGHTRRGGAGVPILGWGRITSLSIVSQKVIQDLVDSLAEYVPEE